MGVIGFRRKAERLPDPKHPPARTSWSRFFLRPSGVIAIGQAQETDTAFAILAVPGAPSATMAIDQALEQDVARAMTAVRGAAGAVAEPNRVALSRYTLEVAWTAHAKGSFIIGTSTIGGTDTLGVSQFDVSFTGPYDDLSALFRGARITRGRSDNRTQLIEGRATITVKDPAGLLNPKNAAGPLYASLGTRYQDVRLRGYSPSGEDFPLYYGYIEKIEWEPSRRHAGSGVAVLTCRDLLLWLSEARPIIASTGPTTTGAAIGLVLDAMGFVNPLARSLDVGDTIPDFSADGSKSGLQIIGELLLAERGTFYADAAGRAVYEDRLTRTLKEPVAVIAHEMRAAVPSIDHSRLRNRVRVRRTQNDYVATALDETARTLAGDLDLEEIETPYLSSDSQADALASFVLAQLGSPLEPLRDLEIDNRTEELLVQCLAREFGDVVTVAAAGAQIVLSDFAIESLEHTIEPTRRRHATKWLLSEHETISPFVIGSSVLVAEGAEGDVLVY